MINLKKNVIIGILIVVILGLIASYLLAPKYSTESTNIMKVAFEAQVKVSEYIGKLRSDTFDVYTVEQLITSYRDLEKEEKEVIKDTSGKEISPLVSTEDGDIKEKDETKYYKANMSNFATILNVQLINDSNLTWYLSDSGVIKLSYKVKPNWWTDEFEVMHIN